MSGSSDIATIYYQLMLKEAVYEILDTLATNYIPKGRHKYLHVDRREAWKKLMEGMLEKGFIHFKMAILVRYAKNWEVVITTRISFLN